MPLNSDTANGRARILCVDDDAPSRAVIAAVLRDYQPEFAATGGDAVAAVTAAPFDLIVLDHWLPDYTGAALCREFRRDDPHVPIIFWTVAEKDCLEPRALRAGASVYLEKTPEYEALRIAASELLERARGQLEPARRAAMRAVQDLRSQ